MIYSRQTPKSHQFNLDIEHPTFGYQFKTDRPSTDFGDFGLSLDEAAYDIEAEQAIAFRASHRRRYSN